MGFVPEFCILTNDGPKNRRPSGKPLASHCRSYLTSRTLSRAAAMNRHLELLQQLRGPTKIPVKTRIEAAEIDVNAEIDQMPGANNVRLLPSTQIVEVVVSAASKASGTDTIRLLVELVAGKIALSRERNQHPYDVRLKRINGLLVSGNADDLNVCAISEETYTAPLDAPTIITKRHASSNCRRDYTTTPRPGDSHDACAMPGCLYVFGRCFLFSGSITTTPLYFAGTW